MSGDAADAARRADAPTADRRASATADAATIRPPAGGTDATAALAGIGADAAAAGIASPPLAAMAGDTDAPAPADADMPGGTKPMSTTTINDTQVAKLARKILKGDVAAAAHAIVLLQLGGLSPAQVDVLRAVGSFMIADIATAPAAAAEPEGERQKNTPGGRALATRVRALADAGDRVNRAMRANKLGRFDATVTPEFVEGLSDEDCLALVEEPVFEGATAAERLDA